MHRRTFIKSATASTALTWMPFSLVKSETQRVCTLPVRTKIALNSYSFNRPLMSGEMTMDDMLDYAAQVGFEGIDLTGYYFPGYPTVPTDDYIYHIKQKAFHLGLEICGSGVRNDFNYTDQASREEAVQLVKNWIEVVSKLGGQTLRVFAGKDVMPDQRREDVFQKIVNCIKECAEYGRNHGVVLAIQNHDDFLKTADQVEALMKAVESPWVGLMLDIGSYRKADPYLEIKQTIKYAITWQIKEEVTINGAATKTDFHKLKDIIADSTFRGYLPIETLGEGDPKAKIARLIDEIRNFF